MGAKHTTERERELFQQLISTGMSVRKISRLTGRSHDTVSNYVNSDVAQHTLPTATTEEEMYKVFDLHHAGKRTIDIAIEMNRPPSTIRMIVKRLYQKHENAYQRWIEMQTQKESPALVMEVQTVENKPCDCDCNFTDSKICQAMSYSIENQRAIIANHEESIKRQSLLIVECQETITLLKEHIQLLKSLR
jgi:IS30 family transposase